MTTIYITRYALTNGIESGEAKGYSPQEPLTDVIGAWNYVRVGRDSFLTLDEARAQAEKMRKKKIVSLRKQIAKLEALDFSEAQATPLRTSANS